MSIWENDFEKRESLSGNKKTDTVIIGGGIAGILTAYRLKKEGIGAIILEKNRIFSGVTKNTTAKITSQHNLIYDKLIRNSGKEKALMYLKANQRAVDEYYELCKNIDCDFERKNSFVYTLNDNTPLENEIKALEALDFKAKFTKETNLPFKIKGAIEFENQAQFNPFKFLKEISKDLEIYENTQGYYEDKNTVRTENGKIRCNNIVIATHFPFIDRYGMYYMKMYQQRSYVLALQNAGDVDGMYINENGLSFRNYKDCLLLGGGGHRTGKQGGGYKELFGIKEKLYPKSDIYEKWATQDCMTLDNIPYIGKYCTLTPNMYVITGFNKWGMTNSLAGSKVICDLIMGTKNEFEELYSPKRLTFNKQLFINLGETVKGLSGFSDKRCTHLGCKLQYNKQEKSWDCPCHGSRFDEKGNVINNPADKNLKREA